jgi:hypothetical protein
MPQPKLSKSVQTLQNARNAKAAAAMAEAPSIDALNPTDAERALGTVDAIVEHREQEKQALLARVGVVPQSEPILPVLTQPTASTTEAFTKLDDVLSFLGGRGDAARRERDDARRAELEAQARPLIAQIHASMTSHGALKARWLARVEGIAGQNWGAVFEATPQNLVFDAAVRGNVSPTHRALHRLKAASEFARDTLRSTFGDSQPGQDIDPVNAADAASLVEAILAGGDWLHRGTDTVSPTWGRAFAHLEVWAKRAHGIAEAAREGVERFAAAEAQAKLVLADVMPLAVEPTPPREWLPEMPQRPAPEFEWSGDVRTLSGELAEHAKTLKNFPEPVQPGSVGKGVVAGITGGRS